MSSVVVNGKACELAGEPSGSLLALLRTGLGLTGAKPGCGEGECGACTVLVDGAPVLACQARAADVAGRSVVTAEGLAPGGRLHPVQQALLAERATQCGYCTPGMAVRAAALLAADPDPTDDQIRAALAPNVCRCGCYPRITRAVHRAAALLHAPGPPEPGPVPRGAPLARPRRPWDLCQPAGRDWAAVLGDGLVVVWPPPAPAAGTWQAGGGAWLHVAPSGLVTAFTGKVDVGQDNQTAADPATARRAVDAIRAVWDRPPPGAADTAGYLRSHPDAGQGWDRPVDRSEGDTEAALAGAAVRVEASYTTAYLAHVPLETRAAVADWEGGRLTVRTGCNVPFPVRAQLAKALGIDEADVRVIVPPTGGGFGGKHGEEAIEAARLARAAGRPVSVHWTRAEEFTWGYLRPMAVIDIRAALDATGAITAWDFLDINAGAQGTAFPYATANWRLRYRPAASPLAQGPYRALGATANTFARESCIDELAHAAGAGPLRFRLGQLADERLAAVTRAAAGRFGWAAHQAAGTRAGWGIAAGLEKGGRVATCAEVHAGPDGRLTVTRIVTAYECGAVVSPDTVIAQIEGGTIMALGGALFEQVILDHGQLASPSLASYRVPRFSDVPEVTAVLIDRPDIPSAGAGETPLIAVAPAIANAIFAATGRRLRSLPLIPGAPPSQY